jgi:hypothetical protein
LASEQMLGDGDISFRHTHGEDVASSSDGSSPLGWPLGRTDRPSGEPSPSSSELNRSRDLFMWEEKREKRQTVLSGTFPCKRFQTEPRTIKPLS